LDYELSQDILSIPVTQCCAPNFHESSPGVLKNLCKTIRLIW